MKPGWDPEPDALSTSLWPPRSAPRDLDVQRVTMPTASQNRAQPGQQVGIGMERGECPVVTRQAVSTGSHEIPVEAFSAP